MKTFAAATLLLATLAEVAQGHCTLDDLKETSQTHTARHLPVPHCQRSEGRSVPEHQAQHQQQLPRDRPCVQRPALQCWRRKRSVHNHRLSDCRLFCILHCRSSRLPPRTRYFLHDKGQRRTDCRWIVRLVQDQGDWPHILKQPGYMGLEL